MSSLGSGLRLTPKTRLYPTHSPTRNYEDDRFQLLLKTVIGTTTNCPNAFDFDPTANTLAYCAGPAAIVCKVAQDLAIQQTLYRARPNAQPLNPTSSFYNPATPPATPTRSRHISPLRDLANTNAIHGAVDVKLDSPGNGKFHNRSREATCISLSRDQEALAVGETGYNPRVLLFALTPNASPDVPLSILSDHSFGVQAVAFSPDCKWLCTLGNSYDGFLLLYSVNLKTGASKLHSSNKCSNVSGITWMGDAIVSYGTRHVKVWRIEKTELQRKARLKVESSTAVVSSPIPRTLTGRNCILGDLIDVSFTCAVAVGDSETILGTSKGDICVLDDASRSQQLDRLSQVSFRIDAIDWVETESLVWVGGSSGGLQAFDLRDMRLRTFSNDNVNVEPGSPAKEGIVALGRAQDHLVMISSDHAIDFALPKSTKTPFEDHTPVKRLPAHESPVLGVCFLTSWRDRKADFLTYSAQGNVLFWRLDGSCVDSVRIPLQQFDDISSHGANEVKAVSAIEGQNTILCGDKMGTLQLIEGAEKPLYQVQAHASDVNSIVTASRSNQLLICTCGRDRTMQVFNSDGRTLELLQTLDEHMASVTDARFCENASILISISLDRTIVIRRAANGEDGTIAFVLTRTITLKSSPVSLSLVPFDSSALVVSSMDRQVQKFEIGSGRLLGTLKPMDPLTGDSVMVNCLQVASLNIADGPTNVVLAVSATDRTIRVYDYDNWALLARESGQAAVSAATILQADNGLDQSPQILSCGHDGTVIIYDMNSRQSQRFDSTCSSPVRAESPLRQTPTSLPPLRKTLTKSQISDLQKSLEGQQDDTDTPLRSPSPSRIRPKNSRYSLAPRAAPLTTSTQSIAEKPGKRRTSQDHSPKNASPQNSIKVSKPKSRPSLDPRRRSKSAANLNDLNLTAENLCEALRTFRKRLSSAVADKVNQTTRRELQSELDLALRAIGHSPEAGQENMPFKPGAEAFDAYLAKMIDERLSMKSPPEQSQNQTEEAISPDVIEGQSAPGAQI